MKLNGSNFGPSVAARVLAAISCLLTASASLGEALSFRWRTEVSSAAPYEAQAMQGESFALEATLVQYGAPLTGEATATFYYQTKLMASTEWFSAPAAWDEATATASVTWSPALDVGQSAYRWFFGIDTAQGHNYRAYGTLRLKPSPGFSPALLEPIDLREQLKAELYAQLQADLSAAFSTDLQAEAQAREAADSTITEAVNAQAGVLEQHQGYLSTLSGNFNALYSSYTNTVSELQATDAAHESALATKADASALTNHAATWATESTGGHVKLGTNSILSTADGNYGVVGKTSNNQLIYRLDATPTQNSSLPVKSGGVYTALAAKAALEHTHSQYLTTESDPTVSAWAKAATKPTYTWTEILNRPTTWDWANLTNKPTAFTPAEHNHDGTYLKLSGGTVTGSVTFGEDKESSSAARADLVLIQDNSASNLGGRLIFKEEGWLDQAAMFATWASTGGHGDSNRFNIGTATGGTGTTLATTFTPRLSILFSSGNVGIGTNSPNEKLHVSGNVRANAFNEGGVLLSNKYAAKAHSHAINEVTNLQVALDGKAAATHTHAMADTTGLQAALDSLAPLSSVTCTTNNVTYIWQWDDDAGTFALVER